MKKVYNQIMQPYLSVVLPSYNEKRNIERGVLDEVYNFLQDFQQDWELILSDDGSQDGSVADLEKFASRDKRIKLLKNPHRGKGPTVKAGMLEAQGKWQLFADFDQSTPLREIRKLLKYSNSYQVIVGSREIEGAKREKEPFYRHIMGRGFNLLVQLLAVPSIQDTQCGFKLLSKEASHLLFNKLYIYGGKEQINSAFTGAFDVELLYLAKKYNFQIKEVPILWKHFSTDRVSPIRDSFLMFYDVLQIKWADIRQKYS